MEFTARLRRLSFIGFLCLPLTAWSDGPECGIDPDTGLPAPDGPGVCFFSSPWFMAFLDSDLDFFFVTDADSENHFFRVHPNQNFFHVSEKDVFLAFCSPTTVIAGECVPGSPLPFLGTADVSGNGRTSAFFSGECPQTGHVRGTATDGFGNQVRVKADYTLVPTPDGSCRFSLLRIEGTPTSD